MRYALRGLIGMLLMMPALSGCAVLNDALSPWTGALTTDEQRVLDIGNFVCVKYQQPTGCILTMTPDDMARVIEASGGLYGRDHQDFSLAHAVLQTRMRRRERRRSERASYQYQPPPEPKTVRCVPIVGGGTTCWEL